jgi:hypothetical protein
MAAMMPHRHVEDTQFLIDQAFIAGAPLDGKTNRKSILK